MAVRTVYACDVGSTRHATGATPKFAWVRVDADDSTYGLGSHSIDELVSRMARDLNAGASIAVGFEAPLFMPVPLLSSQLSSSRKGEGNRSFAAPAGSTVALLALHQCAWILTELRKETRKPCNLTVDVGLWPPRRGQLLLFWS